MAPSRGRIAPEGLPFIAGGAGLALLTVPFSRRAGAALALLTGAVAAFFRDPARTIPEGDGLVVAPADGRIVQILPAPDDGEGTVVSIFLSLFDVHVNRAPIGGRIAEVTYHPGSFLPAFREKASLLNEQNRTVIDGSEGRVGLTQIAGLVARRIVFHPRVGDAVERGERVGLIRFGSRTDIALPPSADLRVAVGDRVRGGTSVLAVLQA